MHIACASIWSCDAVAVCWFVWLQLQHIILHTTCHPQHLCTSWYFFAVPHLIFIPINTHMRHIPLHCIIIPCRESLLLRMYEHFVCSVSHQLQLIWHITHLSNFWNWTFLNFPNFTQIQFACIVCVYEYNIHACCLYDVCVGACK